MARRPRRPPTRYDRLARNYQAAITLVSTLLWISADLVDTAYLQISPPLTVLRYGKKVSKPS